MIGGINIFSLMLWSEVLSLFINFFASEDYKFGL
jgi:hypothetical protein